MVAREGASEGGVPSCLSRQGECGSGPSNWIPTPANSTNLGQKLKIFGKPIQILNILLEHPGELVSREEIR